MPHCAVAVCDYDVPSVRLAREVVNEFGTQSPCSVFSTATLVPPVQRRTADEIRPECRRKPLFQLYNETSPPRCHERTYRQGERLGQVTGDTRGRRQGVASDGGIWPTKACGRQRHFLVCHPSCVLGSEFIVRNRSGPLNRQKTNHIADS